MKYIKLFEGIKLSGEFKSDKGTPEELVELLKELPVNETADYIRNQIIEDLTKYYEGSEKMIPKKEYTYAPENKCIQPYTVLVEYFSSNNDMNLGYCEENYIQVKYLNKECGNYKTYNIPNPSYRISRGIYNIIKHECSHAYLGQKGIEACLYHTDPKGLDVYYQDRQEMVLHSREIFDDFIEYNSKWKTMPIKTIEQKIKDMVKSLKYRTNIHGPAFGSALQKKYVAFIMNSYIKPELNKTESFIKRYEDIEYPPEQAAPLNIFLRYYTCKCELPSIAPVFINYCPNCHHKTREISEREYLGFFKSFLQDNQWQEFKKDYFQYFKHSIISLDDLNQDGDKTEYNENDPDMDPRLNNDYYTEPK